MLKSILGTIVEIYPEVKNVPIARTTSDFKDFLNKTVSVDGKQIRFAEFTNDLLIPYTFLHDHEGDRRYLAISRAMAALVKLDFTRSAEDERVLGPTKLINLGHLAIFAVGQSEYTNGFREIAKERTKKTKINLIE